MAGRAVANVCGSVLCAVFAIPAVAVAQVSGDVERRLLDQQRRDQIDQLQDQLRQPAKPLIEGQPVPRSPVGPDSEVDQEGGPPIQRIDLEDQSGLVPEGLVSLDGFVGLPATESRLKLIRMEVAAQLERSHYLAEVGLPSLSQEGDVRVPLVLARLGAVLVEDDRGPIKPGWAIATVLDAVGIGNILRMDKLESALLKLNDLGAVKALARLEPGATPGSTNVLLKLETTRQVQAEINLNNDTTEYTGPYQVQGGFAFNGLLGRGEIFNLSGSYSGDPSTWGSRSAALSLNLPLTPGGLNALASVSWSDYRLLDEFYDDDYTGDFVGASLGLTQVMWRRPKQNLYWRAGADFNQFNDSVLGFQYSDRTSWAGRFSLLGDSQDQWLGSGLNSGLLTLSVGTLNLNGELDVPDLGDKAGPWGKLNLLLNRYQMFQDSRWSLEFLGQAQLAFTNLDSIEKMSLGWPNAVRAYPPGEAAGDSGVSAQVTARYQLARNLVAKAFVDGGYVWKVFNTYQGLEGSNDFGLWGPGLGLEWGTRGDVIASVDIAWPIGENLNNPIGVDVDGDDASLRVWVSVRKWL